MALTSEAKTNLSMILSRTSTLDSLIEISDMVNDRIRQVRAMESLKYRPGQKIQFRARGNIITGTIERVNQKTLSVKNCSDKSPGWRVGYGHIDKIL